MSKTITLAAVPGVVINQNLPSVSKIAVVDIANGTPFDLTYVGFGCPGEMIIEAGLKVRLHAEVLDTGQMQITPVNNVGVSGTGIINVTVYFVNDTLPKGIFPVAIPTQIVSAKVSSVVTLSNEGGAVGTEVIDIGTVNNSKLVDIFNDHFIWKVEQAGVAHQVLKGNASGTPLQIGQAADLTEVLGTLQVDGGTIGVATAGDLIDGSLTNATYLKVRSAGTFHFQTPNGTDVLTLDSSGNLNMGHTNPSGSNNVNANGNVRINGALSMFDNGGTARPFATNLAATNSNTLFTSANDGKIHVMNSAQTLDIATFADSSLVTNLLGRLRLDSGIEQQTSGSVGGNATFYTPIWGNGLKVLIVTLNGWNSAVVATFTFPFSLGIQFGWFFSSYGSAVANTWGLFIGPTAQAMRHMLTLGGAAAAGTDEAITAVKSDNMGVFALTGGAATSVQIGTTGGAANSGVIVVVGV